MRVVAARAVRLLGGSAQCTCSRHTHTQGTAAHTVKHTARTRTHTTPHRHDKNLRSPQQAPALAHMAPRIARTNIDSKQPVTLQDCFTASRWSSELALAAATNFAVAACGGGRAGQAHCAQALQDWLLLSAFWPRHATARTSPR